MNKLLLTVFITSFAISLTAFADDMGSMKMDDASMGEHCTMHSKLTFEQADKDHDGTLDRDEAKLLCKEKFEVMDTDKDGSISKKEYQACNCHKCHKHHKKTNSSKAN